MIGIKYATDWDIVVEDSREWVLFGCGRVYVNDPAGRKRHEQSGCKGCRRWKRRFAAMCRAAQLQSLPSVGDTGGRSDA